MYFLLNQKDNSTKPALLDVLLVTILIETSTKLSGFSLASDGVVSTVVVHLPDKARRPDVCLKWGQPDKTTNYTGCWALDNVLVNDMADQPISLQDNFDPVDPGNWLFFPGARILVGSFGIHLDLLLIMDTRIARFLYHFPEIVI